MDNLLYNWVLHNADHNRGRIGYFVTAGLMSRVQAEKLAEQTHARLVMPILESAQVQLTALTDICPDCKRDKAHSAHDIAVGLCPKWYAIRDEEADRDCLLHTIY